MAEKEENVGSEPLVECSQQREGEREAEWEPQGVWEPKTDTLLAGYCGDDDDDEQTGQETKADFKEQSEAQISKESPKDDRIKRVLQAAEKNNVEALRELLEEDPSLVSATDSDKYTPLHRACYNNRVEVIKVLLSFDADVSAKTVDGRQPLHCACQWDCVEAASLLLQNGADINALTLGKLSPLHLASANASARRTLELLLWHPYINCNLTSEGQDSAYDTARRSSPFATLYEILEESLNVY